MSELRECYRQLEVEPCASPEEVKRAYRELVKIWHPDRFADDPKLQRKAQEKLKLINLAYGQICKAGFSVPPHATTSAGTTSRGAEQQTPPPDSGSSSESKNDPQRAGSRQPSPSRQRESNSSRRFVQIAAVVIVIAVITAVLLTDDSQRRTITDIRLYLQPAPTDQPPEPAKPVANVTLDAPKPATPTPAEEAALALQNLAAQPRQAVTNVQDARSAPRSLAQTRGGDAILDAQEPTGQRANITPPPGAATAENRGFFTVGSTKGEVLAIQGTPDKFDDTVFTYPYGSEVIFRNNRVTSWKMSPTFPLKVKLLPASAVENRGFFTVGSTKDEVLVVQGTPDKFTDTVFTYPYGSEVIFQNDHVMSWRMSPTFPLKVKLLPKSAVQNRGFFTVGSTKDEVLVVQGTPDRFTNTVFTYPYGSEVIFRNDHVTSWKMSPTFPLNVKQER